jgi:hypothetical protein
MVYNRFTKNICSWEYNEEPTVLNHLTTKVATKLYNVIRQHGKNLNLIHMLYNSKKPGEIAVLVGIFSDENIVRDRVLYYNIKSLIGVEMLNNLLKVVCKTDNSLSGNNLLPSQLFTSTYEMLKKKKKEHYELCINKDGGGLVILFKDKYMSVEDESEVNLLQHYLDGTIPTTVEGGKKTTTPE